VTLLVKYACQISKATVFEIVRTQLT